MVCSWQVTRAYRLLAGLSVGSGCKPLQVASAPWASWGGGCILELGRALGPQCLPTRYGAFPLSHCLCVKQSWGMARRHLAVVPGSVLHCQRLILQVKCPWRNPVAQGAFSPSCQWKYFRPVGRGGQGPEIQGLLGLSQLWIDTVLYLASRRHFSSLVCVFLCFSVLALSLSGFLPDCDSTHADSCTAT